MIGLFLYVKHVRQPTRTHTHTCTKRPSTREFLVWWVINGQRQRTWEPGLSGSNLLWGSWKHPLIISLQPVDNINIYCVRPGKGSEATVALPSCYCIISESWHQTTKTLSWHSYLWAWQTAANVDHSHAFSWSSILNVKFKPGFTLDLTTVRP